MEERSGDVISVIMMVTAWFLPVTYRQDGTQLKEQLRHGVRERSRRTTVPVTWEVTTAIILDQESCGKHSAQPKGACDEFSNMLAATVSTYMSSGNVGPCTRAVSDSKVRVVHFTPFDLC